MGAAVQQVAVVIPYFQRRSGVLARTVESALGQQGDICVRIIVADDSSPVPADVELAPIIAARPGLIEIVRRPNGGPASARNAGLDHVPPECSYVAFLDSDDVWQPDHLCRAVAALEQGYDVFLADWRFTNDSQTAFDRSVFRPDRGSALGDGIWVLDESLFDRVFGRDNMTHLSVTVYRHAAFPALRFVDTLWMGEDIIFYLDLANRGARAVVSNAVEMIRGAAEIGAVSIYEGAGWGSPRALWRLKEELRYHRLLEGRYALTETHRRLQTARRRSAQEEFILALLHQLRRGRMAGLDAVLPALAIDPGLLAVLPRVLSRRVFGSPA